MTEAIALVGFGNMGRALASGWVADGRDPGTITVTDANPAALDAARAAGFATAAVVGSADVVVLAVKPNQVDGVVRTMSVDGASTVILSIAAGRTIGSISAAVGGDAAVVRAMPNTPAAIGRGVTGLCASRIVSSAQRDLCEKLMAAVGTVVWVETEALIDAITAVSGSGPAYVFLMIECLAAAGRSLGLDDRIAETLATATVAGAGAYAAVAEVDAAELRRRVTSPHGTTEAALDVLMAEDGLAGLLKRAVEAAEKRSRELAADA